MFACGGWREAGLECEAVVWWKPEFLDLLGKAEATE
jgi:hypothetical protein